MLESTNPFATFTLPSGAIEQTNPRPKSVAFCAFMNDKLYTRRRSYLMQADRASFEVGSQIISAHFDGNISVSNLLNEVTMNFMKKEVKHIFEGFMIDI